MTRAYLQLTEQSVTAVNQQTMYPQSCVLEKSIKYLSLAETNYFLRKQYMELMQSDLYKNDKCTRTC